MISGEYYITSVVFLPKMQNRIVYMENIRQTQIEGCPTKQLTSIFQKCQGHKRLGKTKELVHIGGDKGDMET